MDFLNKIFHCKKLSKKTVFTFNLHGIYIAGTTVPILGFLTDADHRRPPDVGDRHRWSLLQRIARLHHHHTEVIF